MSAHGKNRRGIRPAKSTDFGLVFEDNDVIDARKLSRAFLALALHQAAEEAHAQADHLAKRAEEHDDERA